MRDRENIVTEAFETYSRIDTQEVPGLQLNVQSSQSNRPHGFLFNQSENEGKRSGGNNQLTTKGSARTHHLSSIASIQKRSAPVQVSLVEQMDLIKAWWRQLQEKARKLEGTGL